MVIKHIYKLQRFQILIYKIHFISFFYPEKSYDMYIMHPLSKEFFSYSIFIEVIPTQVKSKRIQDFQIRKKGCSISRICADKKANCLTFSCVSSLLVPTSNLCQSQNLVVVLVLAVERNLILEKWLYKNRKELIKRFS